MGSVLGSREAKSSFAAHQVRTPNSATSTESSPLISAKLSAEICLKATRSLEESFYFAIDVSHCVVPLMYHCRAPEPVLRSSLHFNVSSLKNTFLEEMKFLLESKMISPRSMTTLSQVCQELLALEGTNLFSKLQWRNSSIKKPRSA